MQLVLLAVSFRRHAGMLLEHAGIEMQRGAYVSIVVESEYDIAFGRYSWSM